MFLGLFHNMTHSIIKVVDQFGYAGIFIMTFIESTFIPIPSEITLIPAGYLVYQKQMGLFPIMLTSLLGTLLGSLLNYYIAYRYGRKLFINYGKFFFLERDRLLLLESFFASYGNISTFFGRMLPGIKHFISFPAGLAQMNIVLFCIYTLAGSSIWLTMLLYIGYIIGTNQYLITIYIKRFNYLTISIVLLLSCYFYISNRLSKVNKTKM